jgi:hypothetical protein
MELYSNLKNSSLCKLSVSGNSRLRILNDYEDGLISNNSIEYDGYYIKIVCHNLKNLPLNNKCYITFKYNKFKNNEHPYIDHIWEYDQFIPSYVIYPIRKIKQATLDFFNINTPIKIDKYEMQKNERISYNEYKIYNFIYGCKKKKIAYPYIISKYGKFINLQKKNQNNIKDDLNTKNIDSENNINDDSNDDEFDEILDINNTFLFDAMQLN